MATGKLRHGTNFAITTASLFVILVVINVFSSRHFLRLDLTRNKDYTISKTTRGILAGLDNIVNVTVYLSEDLPAALLTFERQLLDTLDEFEVYGRGKLRVRYVHPSEDNETRQDLMITGVQPQMVGEISGDRQTRSMVYNSIVIQFEEKKEVIRNLLESVGRGIGLTSDFEYLLTSKISRVLRPGDPVIGWLTNAPGLKIDERYSVIKKQAEKEWTNRVISLDPPRKIPQDIKVLVIVSPRNFTSEQLFEIDQYVMRGGKILALVDTYDLNEANGALINRSTNFVGLLEHYGLKVNNEVIRDDRYRAILLAKARIPMPYPFWIHVLAKYMDSSDRVVAGLKQLTFPWAQSIDRATTVPEGVTYKPLAWSSPSSRVRWGKQVNLNPQAPVAEQSAQPTTYAVVASLNGRFPSFFPEDTPYPLDAASTFPQVGRTEEQDRLFISGDTEMIVVGNALFLQNEYLGGWWRMRLNRNNDDAFFLNALESLAHGTTLGKIRSRTRTMHPIKTRIMRDDRAQVRNAWKFFGTITMPVLVVIGGVLYSTFRRRRRRVVADRILKG